MNRRNFIQLTSAGMLSLQANAIEQTSSSPLITFGLLTDVQYADAETQDVRHYRSSLPKLQAAVADLSTQHLPFSLHLGDVIDRDFASYSRILPVFEALGHPIYHALGNHDYSIPDQAKPDLKSLLKIPNDYYTFTHSGVQFIILDTNDISTYKHATGTQAQQDAESELRRLQGTHAKNAYPWNGKISKGQMDWLHSLLDEADRAERPVLVCGHHPIVPADGHELWNADELKEMLLRHPSVCAYLNGHQHGGSEVIIEGLPFITFKSLLHTPEITAYSILKLYPDRLEIIGHGREASRSIALAKRKKTPTT